MGYEDALKASHSLVKILGEGNAHLIYALGMYLDEPDLEALASEALTDGPNDKKIDFIYLDQDTRRIVFAQGYRSTKKKDSAPANKASDLNTASAWLLSGDVSDVPDQLKPAIENCRTAIQEGEVDAIELFYVHNLPESVNVTKELQTAAAHLRKTLPSDSDISVTAKEFGRASIEHLFSTQESHIEVKDQVLCPANVLFTEKGPKWSASVLSVPGEWLHDLFAKHSEALFSANYRGFLGITKRRRINTGIRSSAEARPKDFWVFNNGITLLTMGIKSAKAGTELTGVSIINGAQTTGSIGSVDAKRHDLKDLQVLCRIIECSDSDTISEIVKFNNTQNEIATWDQYSNDTDQNRIEEEFRQLGHKYSRKRGFRGKGEQIGIEEVAQPLVAFHGRFSDANGGKNRIFERKPLYNSAFGGKKARHIIFVYSLVRAIDERRLELKSKSNSGEIISQEEQHLALLRNLRFKYFFVAVAARVLETILEKKTSIESVAFSSEAAKADQNSLVDLVAAWSPVVEAILTFLATQMETADVAKRIAEENALEDISNKVSAMLYASRATLPFYTFRPLVSDS